LCGLQPLVNCNYLLISSLTLTYLLKEKIMTNQLITLFSIVTILFLFSNLQIQAQCDDPFSIDWVNNAKALAAPTLFILSLTTTNLIYT